jgi:hypothetical protein
MSDWSSLLPVLLPWLVIIGFSAMGRGGHGASDGASGAGIEVLLIVVLVSVAAIALLGSF